MSNENQETIADIVAEMRLGVKDWKGERLGVFDCFADRIEAAAKRERESGADAAQICGEIGELIGMEAARENSSQVGNAAHKREVAELRECLKEAIREKCPFTRMSCKYGEPCDYECGTVKWRKALQDEGGAK